MTGTPTDLIDAHEALASVLDSKFTGVKEWQAFRAVNRLLIASLKQEASDPLPSRPTPAPALRRGRQDENAPIPYMTLAANALDETQRPMSTVELMDYIANRRTITGDFRKARIVVQSSLSKDDRFRSIPWAGGRAWWWADKPAPAPKEELELGVLG